MIDLETPRLILRLVPLAGLAATENRDVATAKQLIGPSLTGEWFENALWAGLRLRQWKDDPHYAPWSIRAIILKDTGTIVGSINCHDRPQSYGHNGQNGQMVELGYTIFTPWRRRGIATEAFTALANFARTSGVHWIRLSVSPENVPSLELAKKMGASKIGSQNDDTNGPEDVFLLEL